MTGLRALRRETRLSVEQPANCIVGSPERGRKEDGPDGGRKNPAAGAAGVGGRRSCTKGRGGPASLGPRAREEAGRPTPPTSLSVCGAAGRTRNRGNNPDRLPPGRFGMGA